MTEKHPEPRISTSLAASTSNDFKIFQINLWWIISMWNLSWIRNTSFPDSMKSDESDLQGEKYLDSRISILFWIKSDWSENNENASNWIRVQYEFVKQQSKCWAFNQTMLEITSIWKHKPSIETKIWFL
jgi:hypothetical protein